MNKDFKGRFKITKESMKEVIFWLIGGLFLLIVTETH